MFQPSYSLLTIAIFFQASLLRMLSIWESVPFTTNVVCSNPTQAIQLNSGNPFQLSCATSDI
jgi:hypothetical protein